MCLTVFDADTPSGWEGAKKQLKNSYQKRLWKTTYDKLVWSPDMPIWLLKSFCRFFLLLSYNPICIRSMLQSSRATCSFSFQEVFKPRPLPEFIAFPEWCQNFNWHLVSLKTCQEIKVQGTFWTFVDICSWQNLHFWLKSFGNYHQRGYACKVKSCFSANIVLLFLYRFIWPSVKTYICI